MNQLFARASKPTRFQCEDLARKLILKYPFVKDDMGNGYVSVSQIWLSLSLSCLAYVSFLAL